MADETDTGVATDPREVVERFFAAGRAGDLDEVRRLMHPDIVLHQPRFLPYGGTYRGPAEFAELAPRMNEYVSMRTVRVVRLFVEGPYVFALLEVEDARTQEICTMAAHIRVQDGRLAENHVFFHEARSVVPIPAGDG
jgi:uncharacterized protein